MNRNRQRGHGDMGMGLLLMIAAGAACVLGVALIVAGTWLIGYGVRWLSAGA